MPKSYFRRPDSSDSDTGDSSDEGDPSKCGLRYLSQSQFDPAVRQQYLKLCEGRLVEIGHQAFRGSAYIHILINEQMR